MKNVRYLFLIVTNLILFFNLNVSAQYKFQIVVDVNQIWRSELPEAWRLQCDGVWSIPGNSAGNKGWDIPLDEWWAGYSQMNTELTITEDYYLNFPTKNYDLTEAILNQDSTGSSSISRICLYAEPSKPVDPHTTTVVSDQVIQNTYDSKGSKIIVLTRSYTGHWKTEVQRALQHPLVDGVCLEQKPIVSTYQAHKFDEAIRDILDAGKRVYLLLPPRWASDNTIYSDDLEAIFNYIKNNVPDALHNEDLYFIPNCYSRIKDKTTTMYGGDDSVEGSIKRLKELRNSFVNTHWEIPGTIEAESFSAQFGIQTQTTSDEGGGENIGWIQTGDWTEYLVGVTIGGSYDVDFRVASGSNGGIITIKADNVIVGSVNVSGTGGWQTWSTVSTNIDLSVGEQTLKLEYSGGTSYLFNVNWMEFASTVTTADYIFIGHVASGNRLGASTSGVDTRPAANTGVNVQWEEVATDGGFFYLVNNGTDQKLNAPTNTTINMVAAGTTGNTAQWQWVDQGGGEYLIRSRQWGKFFHIDANGTSGISLKWNANLAGVVWTKTAVPKSVTENSLSDNSVNIYPNPASEQITISGIAEGSVIELYDIQGKLQVTKISDRVQETINVQSLKDGMYLLKIVGNKTVNTKILVVK